MLSGAEFEFTIQIVFKYLNTDISIYEIDSLEECKGLSIPFVKCLSKISPNKTVYYHGVGYLWSTLSKQVREKMLQDKIEIVVGLAISYLEGDYTIDFLASLPEVPFSSSSLQRYFKELLPNVSYIRYQNKKYSGKDFCLLLHEKLKVQRSKAPQKGGEKSAIKTTAIKDKFGHFMGSEKKKKIVGKHAVELYDRALYETELMDYRHSSTRLIGNIQGFSKETIRRDFHTVLQNCDKNAYNKVCEQLRENQLVDTNDLGMFINAEEKYQKQKKRRNM